MLHLTCVIGLMSHSHPPSTITWDGSRNLQQSRPRLGRDLRSRAMWGRTPVEAWRRRAARLRRAARIWSAARRWRGAFRCTFRRPRGCPARLRCWTNRTRGCASWRASGTGGWASWRAGWACGCASWRASGTCGRKRGHGPCSARKKRIYLPVRSQRLTWLQQGTTQRGFKARFCQCSAEQL